MAAGALIRDPDGRVLLVKPTYKEGWETPGGLVELDESPRAGAIREVAEELGHELAADAPLLCLQHGHGLRTVGDALLFVFDGGRVAADTSFTLPADELSEHRFVDPADLGAYVTGPQARRLRAACDAADDGRFRYLESIVPG